MRRWFFVFAVFAAGCSSNKQVRGVQESMVGGIFTIGGGLGVASNGVALGLAAEHDIPPGPVIAGLVGSGVALAIGIALMGAGEDNMERALVGGDEPSDRVEAAQWNKLMRERANRQRSPEETPAAATRTSTAPARRPL